MSAYNLRMRHNFSNKNFIISIFFRFMGNTLLFRQIFESVKYIATIYVKHQGYIF